MALPEVSLGSGRWLALAWQLVLPWLAWVATLRRAPESGPLYATIALGWVALLFHQALAAASIRAEAEVEAEARRGVVPKLARGLAEAAPVALVGLNQIALGGDWEGFVLEQFALELATSLLALVAVTAVFSRRGASRDAPALPPWVPLALAGVVLAALSGVLVTWWQVQRYTEAPPLTWLGLALAVLLAFVTHYGRLARVASGAETLPELPHRRWHGLAIGAQVLLWVAMPALRLWTSPA